MSKMCFLQTLGSMLHAQGMLGGTSKWAALRSTDTHQVLIVECCLFGQHSQGVICSLHPAARQLAKCTCHLMSVTATTLN